MAVNLSPVYGVAGQLFDNNGNPLAGGKIFTYLAGSTTPAPTYTNTSGSIAHSNPIILDGAGRVPTGEIWLTDGITYKFVVQDSANNLIGTYDNLTGINSNFVNFTAEQEIQTATAGQTVFNLTTMQYQPGTNSLSVFVDGVNQYGPGAQYAYVETSSTSVTFVSGLHVGASVKFTTTSLTTGNATDASVVSYTPDATSLLDGVATNVQTALDDLSHEEDGSSYVGFFPAGTGAVATTVQGKLRQFVTPEDFGAVGDGVADDTAAVQLAINHCMADPINPLTLLCAGKYYITASLMIDATGVSVTTIRNNKFKIVGIGGASGFYADTGIVMFSATANHSTQSVGRFIQWENLAFVAANISSNTAVLDGAFIQVTFEQCVFTRVYCQQTSGVNTFSYWFFGCYIQDCPSTFFELLYTSANDIIFDGCYFNGANGNAFPVIRLSLVQGFKCTNNTFESLDGTPIVLRGSRACEISGNYFEACGLIGSTYYVDLNEAGTAELAGVSISGNLFYMTSGQDADLAFHAINWDAISAGSSNGNWCTGKLHRVVNAQPGYDFSVNGDTESTTGSLTGRAPVRPTYRQFTSLSSSWYDYKPLSSAPAAVEGRVYYNSVAKKLYCYDGTTWQALF